MILPSNYLHDKYKHYNINIKTVNGRLLIYDCNHVILLIMLMVKYKFITEMMHQNDFDSLRKKTI